MQKTISCTKKITPIGISLLAMWMMSIVIFTFPRSANANIICEWFGYCVYESPAFKIKVVDSETGQPLAGVHALAEWIQYGYHGSGGPLMAVDALSGSDGVLDFPKWGPIRGSSGGLVLNQDPVISLFRPGYLTVIINNQSARDERARVRGLNQEGQTYKLEQFKGPVGAWIKELRRAANPNRTGLSVLAEGNIREAYLNRTLRIEIEAKKLRPANKETDELLDYLARDIKFLSGGSPQ